MRISDWSSDVCSSDLGIFLALGLAVICLCLFVYFIRSISLSIQVDYILNRVYKQTYAQLQQRRERLERCEVADWPDDSGRSEERRGGKECVRTCRSRGSRDHKKKNNNKTTDTN